MAKKISLLFLVFLCPLNAQDYRATLLGLVSDASGAKVPNAVVTALNTQTGVKSKSTTNSDGSYVIPFLIPGVYSVLVEHAGFKAFERGPIELRLNDRTSIDVALEVGATYDRVTVTAEAPLVEDSTASRGLVVDTREVTDVPLNGKNPYTLMQLSASAVFTGSYFYQRPFQEGTAYSINGGRNQTNELLLDGAPDDNYPINAQGQLFIGYVPPIEATQAVKIQTNSYDAQYGRTGGGVTNLEVKSGTNTLHGVGYEYLRRASLEANYFANNTSGTPRPLHTVDQYGFEVGGPVLLPKLYNGKNRTFFMFALERYRELAPQAALGSVPTEAQRNGDFSQTLAQSGKLYTIYDPLTIQPNPAFDSTKPVTLSNLQFLRSPFPNNQIPQNRMNPIALNILKKIPLPNQPGNSVTSANNWFVGNGTCPTDFQNLIGRVDHNVNPLWRVFARWSHEGRPQYCDNNQWFTPVTNASGGNQFADAAALGVTGTLNPTTVVDVRASFHRFASRTIGPQADPTTYGFPAGLVAQLPLPTALPLMQFTNYLQVSSYGPGGGGSTDSVTAEGTITKVLRQHVMKFGADVRDMQYANINLGQSAGSYSFTPSWTSSTPQVTDAASGNAVASFQLGYMASGTVAINAAPFMTWHYYATFFQDDWRVTPRLTFNLGLRYDYDSPFVERYNRMNSGFDFHTRSPFQAPGLNLQGGLLFAGVGGQPKGATQPEKSDIQPRFGVAYRMLARKPLVFRGGVGRYFLPVQDPNSLTGFSQNTSAQTSTPTYLPLNTLSNPFPNGLIQPTGASLGLATAGGQSISFYNPTRKVPYVWQYSAGFQYEIRGDLLFEATYLGSQTSNLGVSKSISYLTSAQLALGTPYLSQVVPNPLYGVLPATTTLGGQPTTQMRNLLTPYPQFTGVTMNNISVGHSWYNALELSVKQRFKYGLSFLASYRLSKAMEDTVYLNPQDANPARQLSAFDAPRAFVFSGLFEFPVGAGKKYANSGLASHVIGGWELSWNGKLQAGIPMPLPSGYYIQGDPKLVSGQTLSHWFNTSPQVWVPRPSDTLQTTPPLSFDIRVPHQRLLNLTLIRKFRIREGHTFEFRASAFNATNTPIFGAPNTNPTSTTFGVVPITQINPPRSVELGFRYAF